MTKPNTKLAGGHSAVAGRLAGAFRRIGKSDIADEIRTTMKAADYEPRESDPFTSEHPTVRVSPPGPPIVTRVTALWELHRTTVIQMFPPEPGLPEDREGYLRAPEYPWCKPAT